MNCVSTKHVRLGLVCLAFGCHWTLDENEQRTLPPPQQLYFPSGLVMDPDGRYLYVNNGNADLRYGGGTLQVVDTFRFNCALDQFCSASRSCGRPSPIDPSCDLGRAVSDAASCSVDPIDPKVVDCDETPFILPHATVRVGNFAGSMRLQTVTQTPPTRRLYTAVRGDPSITWVDIHPELFSDDAPLGGLNCFDDVTAARDRAAPAGCDSSHLIQLFCAPTLTSAGPVRPGADCPTDLTKLPTDPFGLALDEQIGSYSRLVVSHLAGGQISIIDTAVEPPKLTYVSPPFFPADPSGRTGAFALAPQRPGQKSSTWYITSNLQPTIATFRIADVDVVVPSITFGVGQTFAQGTDVRALVFEPGGNRAFVTENNPPSVVVLDTSPSSANPGQPANLIVDAIDVCQTPSHLELRQFAVPGAAGQPSRTVSRLYVVCFLSSQIMVVDPDLARVEETILTGRGPNELAFGADFAFVSNFVESTLSVIDFRPGSPTENRMVARIGKPELPSNGN